jgi:hypothetical protein
MNPPISSSSSSSSAVHLDYCSHGQEDLEKALGNLRVPTERLNTTTAIVYTDYLKLKLKGQIVQELLIEGLDLVDVVKEKFKTVDRAQPLFIPYVMEGHIVVITVDFKQSQIQFYDSKAKGSSKISSKLQELYKLSFPEAKEVKVLDNQVRHQGWIDSVSCGVFAMSFIKRRLLEESFKYIDDHYGNAINLRLEMMQDLKTALPQ